MQTYNYILDTIKQKGSAYFVLLDPDKFSVNKLESFIKICSQAGVDAFLVGGSLIMNNGFEEFLQTIKIISKIPVIIFPGSIEQVSAKADAVLFLSLISGRNPEHLIGKHVLAAPIIHKNGIEPISTGYLLIESGTKTSVEYFSGSSPIPSSKSEIAVATVLAGQYLGMKLIYLEAGSGALNHVPFEMVKAVAKYCTVPLIVGGGITTPEIASMLVKCGAKIIVTGNHFEDEKNWDLLKKFSDAVHQKGIIL
jgi:putative glycerol-1-phosphate prenyltransferase